MTDTICAIATAPGGALGIIRVSGPKAFAAVNAICSVNGAACAPNTIHYTHIKFDADVLDEAMVSIFHAPHSYTGEDCVEISCHGSQYILNSVLTLLCVNGCRMAHPGEYTMRAYLNGKMDLSQAEAVADLIASSNQATHRLAMSQLRGHFSSQLTQLREQLLKLTSLLELELDFSDHEDLEFADRSELLELTKTISNRITTLADSFEKGQAIRQGIPVAIVGKTNVGKSTLLNRLLHEDRAIVTDIHGTTRDTIEDTIDIHGITFRFIDTAGIRQTTDQVEQIGISRTYAAIDKARIVLWVIDAPPTEAEIRDMQARCEGKSLLPIWNKTDLLPTKNKPALSPAQNKSDLLHTQNKPALSSVCCDCIATIYISAKHDPDLSALESAIYKAADIPDLTATDVIVTNVRHYDALLRANVSLLRVIDGLQAQLSGDLLSEDLRQALDTLSEITGGQITPQETLNNIFKNFCVGK